MMELLDSLEEVIGWFLLVYCIVAVILENNEG